MNLRSFRTRMADRRSPVLILLAGWLWIASVGAVERPDVLLIVVDDLRPMLGCYGDARARTPHVDRLAERSVIFEQAYCQYAKCGPSRLSFMSGLRPDSVGVTDHRDASAQAFRKRRADATMLPRWFREHGYASLGLGKVQHDGWDVASDWSAPTFPGREGEMLEVMDLDYPGKPSTIADRFNCPVLQAPDCADEDLFAGRMTTEAIRILGSRDPQQPLFLAMGYRRPHLPFVAPARYFALHQPKADWLTTQPGPPEGSPFIAWFNSDGYGGAAKRLGLVMPNPPTHEEAQDWNGYEMRSYMGVPNYGPIGAQTQLDLLQAYAACISYVDAQIGRLMDFLDRSPRGADTIVVLMADHGWHLGEHSAWGKMTNFEVATRVPLLVSIPGLPSRRMRTPVELVDVYPTLCEATGLPLPQYLEGESLLPLLRDGGEELQAVARSQYARYGERYLGRALRTLDHRYVEWTEGKDRKLIARELYDHRVDPRESRNIASDPDQQKLVELLSKRLNATHSEP